MRLKLFLISFFVSLPLWAGVNVLGRDLGDFIFLHELACSPQALAAQASQEFLTLKLKNLNRFQEQEDLELDIAAGIVVEVKRGAGGENLDGQRILFKKNKAKKLPIASLTKLMTALVVLENYPLSQEIEISKEAVAQEEDIGRFGAGERFWARDLLYSLLVESSNDAAFALSEVIGQNAFVELMNLTAENIGLSGTHFVNPTGLDPDDEIGADGGAAGQISYFNHSTAEDLANLTVYLLQKYPFVSEILGTDEIDIRQADGSFHHRARTTNQLFGVIPEIVGGKTGYTEYAKECFVFVLRGPKPDSYLVNVILGSGDRFGEMQKLIEGTKR